MQHHDIKIERITPEIAKEYLKANKINRKLNDQTAIYYASQMKKGQWTLNGDAIKFLKGGSLGDGQHRLRAVIIANIAIDFLVIREVNTECMTTFDTGKIRTISDMFSMHNIPNYNEIAAGLKKYFALLRDYNNVLARKGGGINNKSAKISRQDYLDEYHKYPELLQEIRGIANNCNKKLKILTRSEIFGLTTYLIQYKHHDIEYVESFFSGLFGIHEPHNSTLLQLRYKLANSIMTNRQLTPIYKKQLIAKTWNCYVHGKELKILSWSESREGYISFK